MTSPRPEHLVKEPSHLVRDPVYHRRRVPRHRGQHLHWGRLLGKGMGCGLGLLLGEEVLCDNKSAALSRVLSMLWCGCSLAVGSTLSSTLSTVWVDFAATDLD